MTVAIDVPDDKNSGWRIYIVVPLLLALGANGTFVAPVAVEGVRQQFNLPLSWAGFAVTIELVFSSITALGLASILARTNVARLSLIATILASGFQIASSFSINLHLFLFFRSMTGLSCGILYATACYWASQHANGVRVLSVSFMFAAILFGVGLGVWPSQIVNNGLIALYGPLGFLGLPVAAAIAWSGNLPHTIFDKDGGALEERTSKDLVLLLVMCAVANGGLQMLWSFAESIAHVRNFSMQSIQIVLSTSAIFSVLGALAASIFDRRIGVAIPLIIGMMIGFVSGLLIGSSNGIFIYGAGVYAYGFATYYALPYLLNAGTTMDNTGRAVGLSAASVYLAGALGPLAGGIIAESISVSAVGWTSATACIGASLCAFLLRRTIT